MRGTLPLRKQFFMVGQKKCRGIFPSVPWRSWGTVKVFTQREELSSKYLKLNFKSLAALQEYIKLSADKELFRTGENNLNNLFKLILQQIKQEPSLRIILFTYMLNLLYGFFLSQISISNDNSKRDSKFLNVCLQTYFINYLIS